MPTVLVTGATDGHGRRVALDLAADGWTVLVHGRDTERGEEVARQAGNGARFIAADLASLREARAPAEDAGEVDALVNNAGTATWERRESADGIELTVAVNYLAHVALTDVLLDRQPAPPRIVNVASIGQARIDWDDPLLERSYEGFRAYAQSKLAQIMWTFDLAERGLRADALHPATLMDTAMVRGSFGRVQSSVEEGAANTVRLLRDDAGSGRYFDREREARADPAAYDPQERARLRELTADLLR
jgi:NAD(P)-dependent dehydrogenase (short-subunit alcohol dehydrogenase family)